MEEKYNSLAGGSSYKRRILEYQEQISEINNSRKIMAMQITSLRSVLLRYGGAYGQQMVEKTDNLGRLHSIDMSFEDKERNPNEQSINIMHSHYSEMATKSQHINDLLASLLK